MNYKLHEADQVWRPVLTFDAASKTWVPAPEGTPALCYEILLPTAVDELLSSSPAVLNERELTSALKQNILRCATLFEGKVSLGL